VDAPVHLPCSSLICALCGIQKLHGSVEMSCPFCHQVHGCDPTNFQPVSHVDLVIHCENCNNLTHLCDLRLHITSGCTEHITGANGGNTSVLTVQQVIDKPPTALLTSLERQAASSVVRRMMAEDPIVTLPTGGHVNNNYFLLLPTHNTVH
jgi:hypothetical protein